MHEADVGGFGVEGFKGLRFKGLEVGDLRV